LLREADRLWRGEPLAGLTGDWARQTRAVLELERLAATIDRATVELALGNEADIAGELSGLVSQHPFVESIVEHLMVALYRSGRQAEALDAYRQARQRLIGELGAEPGPGLRNLHQRILQGDPELAAPARTWTGRSASPNNLPRDIPNFTGRAEELDTLAEAIVSGYARTAVTVVAIDGMAGVARAHWPFIPPTASPISSRTGKYSSTCTRTIRMRSRWTRPPPWIRYCGSSGQPP
jgi:hypothetical protein